MVISHAVASHFFKEFPPFSAFFLFFPCFLPSPSFFVFVLHQNPLQVLSGNSLFVFSVPTATAATFFSRPPTRPTHLRFARGVLLAMSLESREADLYRLHETIGAGLTNIERGKTISPKEDIAVLAAKLKDFFRGLNQIKQEMADLDEDERRVWKKKFKDLKALYSESLNAVKNASNRVNRDELAGDGEDEEEGEETEDHYIKRGDELLDSNKEALRNTLGTVNEARELGARTTTMLEEQNAQMSRIANDLDTMEDSLKVSQRVLRQMGRRMLTDKYIWICIGLGVLGIVGVIVAAQVAKKK